MKTRNQGLALNLAGLHYLNRPRQIPVRLSNAALHRCSTRVHQHRSALADAEIFGHFQRRATDAADNGRAITAGQRINHLAGTVGAVEPGMVTTLSVCLRRFSHQFPRRIGWKRCS